jgi:protein O-GlcNAc transferase
VDPDSAYLAQYRLADLFLDTFPYNAHQTSFDALWAGLPVVTCTGVSLASRVAGCALHQANLADLVTGSLAEYEQLARALVADPARLGALRARAQSARSSSLFDMNRLCRNFEATLRQMWDFHRAGEQPRTFLVGPTNETVT